MKKIIIFILAAAPAFGGCLVIDTATIMATPVCVTGTCETGPGITIGAQFKMMLVPHFEVTGHNSCKATAPISQSDLLVFDVTVAFYDKDGFRTGLGHLYVAKLEAGEKFKHAYEIPDDANVLGPVVTVKVQSIRESAGGNGK